MYATTRVAVSFELKSAKTGEILWSAEQDVSKKHYGITNKGLEIKSQQAYEPAVQDIIAKAMATFPNGPDFVKSVAVKKRSFRKWFKW